MTTLEQRIYINRVTYMTPDGTTRHVSASDLEQRRALTAKPCTLDGKPAVLRGATLDYAIVAAFPTGPQYEYAWETAERVMTDGGDFRS